jgi:translation initiation factor eIF-2B subunit delta
MSSEGEKKEPAAGGGGDGKPPPPPAPPPPPKPKLTKAERRALQEQQRAAKAARQQQQQQQQAAQGKGGKGGGGGGGVGGSASPKQQTKKQQQASPNQESRKAQKRSVTWEDDDKRDDSAVVKWVSHLQPYQDPAVSFDTGAALRYRSDHDVELHPAVHALGYRYATGQIRGGNARCRAMLQCYETVLRDLRDSADGAADVRKQIDQRVLKPAFHYWTEHCRHHSVTMGNAFSFLKTAVASMDREVSWEEAAETLIGTMHQYSRQRIDLVAGLIAEEACAKLLLQGKGKKGPEEIVILTYGHSEAVKVVLLEMASQVEKTGQSLRVMVADSPPLYEGRRTLRALRTAAPEVSCQYLPLHAVPYVLQEGVTAQCLLLGAAALHSDGSVFGRCGSACVALSAHAAHVPVLICAETYKISNRVQLESLTHNEVGPPAAAAENENGDGGGSSSSTGVKRLNLLYDLTPSSCVSGIVTELGIVPPTSVAVLLREMNPSQLRNART